MFFLDLSWTAKEFPSSGNGLRQLLPEFRAVPAEMPKPDVPPGITQKLACQVKPGAIPVSQYLSEV